MDILTNLIEGGALINLTANLITMFVPDRKIKQYGPVVSLGLKVLNTLALNIFKNKNAS